MKPNARALPVPAGGLPPADTSVLQVAADACASDRQATSPLSERPGSDPDAPFREDREGRDRDGAMGAGSTKLAANSGCFPGTTDGKGEGLSALFVHPDEDVYVLTEGGGILSEPPRTFEALAFAPRVAGEAARRRRLIKTGSDRPTEDELLINFANAASLGSHRLPPKVIARQEKAKAAAAAGEQAAPKDVAAATWQMWASDNLTAAIGVESLVLFGEDDDGGAPAAAPAPEAAAEGDAKGKKKDDKKGDDKKKDEKDKKEGKDKKGKEKEKEKEAKEKEKDEKAGAPSSEKPNTGMSVAPIEREEDPTFRKMHIDYKPVLFSGAVGRRGSKGSNTPSDILSPKGDEKRMASAGLANKRDAKGGKGAAAKGKR